MLVALLRRTLAPDEVLNVGKKLPVIQNWVNEIAQCGTANFLLSDSEFVYAHRSKGWYERA